MQRSLIALALAGAALGLPLGALAQATPAGLWKTIDDDGKTLTVQAGTRIASLDELAELPLAGAAGGVALTIGDVAVVEITDNPITGISRVNGEPSLTPPR